MTPTRILVAGAGISGLAAAFTLQREADRRGVPIDLAVVDASAEAGGHARTILQDGWMVERGPNGFLSRGEDAMALVAELKLESRLVQADPASKRRYIQRDGRLLLVPDSPPALITADAIGWRAKLRLLGEPWAPPPPDTDETVFDFAARRLGREIADTFVDTAVSGISAGDSRALSLRSQFPVLKQWEAAHGSLLKAMFKQPKRKGGPTRLLSGDHGMGTITGALEQALNGAVRLGAPIKGLSFTGEQWQVGFADGSSTVADRLVCALPAHATAAIAAGVDRHLSSALSAIPYAPVAVVALGFHRSAVARPLDGYGYLVTRQEQLATLGVLWESSIFPGRAPADHVLLRLIVGGARRPDVRDLDDEGVAALAISEVTQVMGLSAPPVRQWVTRWPSAIAQYNVGHEARIGAIRTALSKHTGFHLCGTGYDGVSFTDAIASARRTARAVVEELAA